MALYILATVNIPGKPKGHGSGRRTLVRPIIFPVPVQNPVSVRNMVLQSIMILTAAHMEFLVGSGSFLFRERFGAESFDFACPPPTTPWLKLQIWSLHDIPRIAKYLYNEAFESEEPAI